ncbi:hypothetical protein T484DRAFT_1848704 [Baffinella frigidus]|nr:hypothetical protein T484DRAFT_1848704 [Cryptophyta sp. CCMP2293]
MPQALKRTLEEGCAPEEGAPPSASSGAAKKARPESRGGGEEIGKGGGSEEAPLDVQTEGSKQEQLEEEADACAVCFATEDLVAEHGCPQCAKDAWRVCEGCEEALTSRRCPICRSDYKALHPYTLTPP